MSRRGVGWAILTAIVTSIVVVLFSLTGNATLVTFPAILHLLVPFWVAYATRGVQAGEGRVQAFLKPAAVLLLFYFGDLLIAGVTMLAFAKPGMWGGLNGLPAALIELAVLPSLSGWLAGRLTTPEKPGDANPVVRADE